MNKEEVEKIYMFNEYVLGYDEGNNDRSCLTISKVISGDMYVMGSLYDGSAKIISLMLDNLQEENKQLKEELEEEKRINVENLKTIDRQQEIIQNALGIANERVNHYHHINNKEVLEDWKEIFDILKGE